jgi:His-Xaa-Ser system protein HxsD
MFKSKIIGEKNQIYFQLKTKNYPLEAIYATAYIFIDRAYVYLDGDPAKEVTVFLQGKDELGKKKLAALQGEFLNELLNYLLRVEVARSNQKIREYIVATALVSSLPSQNPDYFSDSDEEAEAGDWESDPMGIAVSWEEKNKKTLRKDSESKTNDEDGKNEPFKIAVSCEEEKKETIKTSDERGSNISAWRDDPLGIAVSWEEKNKKTLRKTKEKNKAGKRK